MKKNIFIKTLTPRFNSIKPFTGLNYFKYSLDLHNINKPHGVNNKLFVSDINRYELDYLRLSYNKLKIDFYNINYHFLTKLIYIAANNEPIAATIKDIFHG